MKRLWARLKNNSIYQLISLTFVIISFGALLLYFSDGFYSKRGSWGLFDALWWAVVTISTVGYGDIIPESISGKIVAIFIIISGPALMALMTASISSILVEKKFREGEGLETITEKDHVVICGWNEHGENAMEAIFSQSKPGNTVVVLINELIREDVQSVQYKFQKEKIHFVRGDFIKADVLARANLIKAKWAIVLADVSGTHSIEKADERTIFGTMAIKAMAPKVRTCAELINSDNKEHLLRASVDEIVVRGEAAGAMLVKSAMYPGVIDAVKMLINDKDDNRLWKIRVPSKFAGRAIEDYSRHIRNKTGGLILAVLREKKGVELDDVLSGDSTAIDDFIKRKFEESGKEFFGGRKDMFIKINPPDDYSLNSDDFVLVLSKEKPSDAGIMERLVGGNS